MDINIERARILSSLPQFDSRGFGLGALPLNHDARHMDLASLAEVAEVLRTNIPPEADLWDYVQLIYNQGSLPACVSYSIAGMQTVFQFIETGWHRELNADDCYWRNGGDGQHGIDTPRALQWCKDTGLLWVNTTRRYRIGSYAFADPRTESGIKSIKAAIAAKRPCVLALLLPQDFWEGDSTSAVVSSGYHQICLTGYTAERFRFVNSWGGGYGNGGFGSIPWSYLLRPEQQNFTYAFTAIDAVDTNLLRLNKVEPVRASTKTEEKLPKERDEQPEI
jgi:hypothetical protein